MEIIILITALIFFFLGRWSIKPIKFKKREESIDQIVEKYKSKSKDKIKPGVLPFKTNEDFEDERSGDKSLEKSWIKSGKAKRVKDFFEK